MSAENRTALTPASLATDGNQGEVAKADGPCGCDDTATEAEVLAALAGAIHAARTLGRCYAAMTCDPLVGAVEATDWIDLAADAIAQAVTP